MFSISPFLFLIYFNVLLFFMTVS